MKRSEKQIYVRKSLDEDPDLWPKVFMSSHLNDLLLDLGNAPTRLIPREQKKK